MKEIEEIVLPASTLKEALPGFSKVIGRAKSLPVLQTLRFGRDAKGKITIQGTDLDAYLTYTAKETQTGGAVEMLVPMPELSKTVKTLNSGDIITFAPDCTDTIKIRYPLGGSMVERVINSVPVDEFPPMPELDQPSIALEPGFGQALRQALACCSGDQNRRILQGACLDVSDEKFHYVVSTNGRSLYSANSFCFDLKKSVIIPDSKFLEWPDFLDDQAVMLSVKPGLESVPASKGKPGKPAETGWIKLESGCWTYVTKEIEGQFPNWKQVVPAANSKWTKVMLSEAAIKQLILILPSLPGDDCINRTVRLRVDRCLSVEGRNRDDKDWTSIPVQDVTITGKAVTIGLNREYLLNGLRFGLNQLEIADPLTPVVMLKAGKKMVILPVNLDPKPTATPAPPAASAPPTAAPTTTQPATQPTPEPATQERNEMPKPRTTTPVANETAPTEAQHNGSNNGTSPVTKSLIDQVDQIKDSLRNTIRELSDLSDFLKQAEKDKKATDKEIEAVRTKLRQIQNVSI